MQGLVLASSSRYRAELLSRLGIDFTTISPDIDETPRPDEPPRQLAARLAMHKAEKAQAMLTRDSRHDAHPKTTTPIAEIAAAQAIIIASDQVASTGEQLLGKPGNHASACRQLADMSGRVVVFHTALHVLELDTGAAFSAMNTTRASLRVLDNATIDRYVTCDTPLDCAGSFKVESLGISLFESVSSDDPTALVGLPMIELCRGLRQFGIRVP